MITDELMRDVRRLQLRTRRRVDALFAGEYHAAFKGQGVEFADVRPYEPGDDVRAIDWNVTARTRTPHIKRFVEERQLTLNLVVDVSASGKFGSGSRTLRRLAAETAAVLTLAAASNGDRVGAVLFSDRLERHVPPRLGRTHTLRIIREIMGADPVGDGTDLPRALETAGRLHPRQSIIVLMSDLLIPEPQLAATTRQARQLTKRHEIVVARLDDPALESLPRMGLLRVRDPETGTTAVVDTLSRRVMKRLTTDRENTIARTERALQAAGCELLALSTARPIGDDLASFFHRRERRR